MTGNVPHMTAWYRMPAGGDALRRMALVDVRCVLAARNCACRLLRREARPEARRALRAEMVRAIRRAGAALDRL